MFQIAHEQIQKTAVVKRISLVSFAEPVSGLSGDGVHQCQ